MIKYWKWKNTIIDFNSISNEKTHYCDYITKKEMVFKWLPLPDETINTWWDGKYPCEYNEALRYAKELGLIEFIEGEENND